MNDNFNDYFRRPGYIGQATTQIDSVNDDWSDYFSRDIQTDSAYNQVDEVSRVKSDVQTYMDAGPVIIKRSKPVEADIPNEVTWSVGNVDEAQSRMVAMQEEWNAMQASFSNKANDNLNEDDDSDMLRPYPKSVNEIALDIIDKETKQEPVNLFNVIQNADKEDIVENTITEDESSEVIEETPVENSSKEIDASEMSNEELLANLGIELNDVNTEPVVEFSDVSVDDSDANNETDDVVEVVDLKTDVISDEPVEDAEIIEDEKPVKKVEKKSSTKKTTAKTNKTATTKTNKSASTKKTKK